MDSQVTDAIYTGGVLKPLGSVTLNEAERVRLIIERIHERVRGILTAKKATLIAAAVELKRTETLEGERLRRLLAGEPVEGSR